MVNSIFLFSVYSASKSILATMMTAYLLPDTRVTADPSRVVTLIPISYAYNFTFLFLIILLCMLAYNVLTEILQSIIVSVHGEKFYCPGMCRVNALLVA